MPETITITLSEEARTIYDRLIEEGVTPERMVAAGLWLADQCQQGNLLIARNASHVDPLWLDNKPKHSLAESFVASRKRRSLKDVLSAEEDIEIIPVTEHDAPASGKVTQLKPPGKR